MLFTQAVISVNPFVPIGMANVYVSFVKVYFSCNLLNDGYNL